MLFPCFFYLKEALGCVCLLSTIFPIYSMRNLQVKLHFLLRAICFERVILWSDWHTIFINNSYANAIFGSKTSAIFLVCFFDVQDKESSSHIFDDTDASATIHTNSVSQPTSDYLSDRPLSNDENRYKVLFTWTVQSSIMCI